MSPSKESQTLLVDGPLIRHVTFSVQDDTGRSIISVGASLTLTFDGESLEFEASDGKRSIHGTTMLGAICNWLALFARDTTLERGDA